ncbi:MAG: lysylphosphatidylglycerol synthase domain-containing protein, partial [Pseudomonadota bacterium]|nr:lysylphosphatidylglycerol synthase domain-containing protein [Pseudomonadota bacterium]
MNKSRIFVLLKILVVAVLLAVIFFAIDWRDHYQLISPEGKPVETVYGKILGRWDLEPVRFLVKDSSEPRRVSRIADSQGRTTVISPGILTYLANLDFRWFGFGAAAFVVFVIIINSRWWWLMRVNGLGVGFFEAQRFAWIGIFCSNVLPGATGGDVVKAVYIVRRCSGDRVRAVVSVVVDRIIGLLSLLFVCSNFTASNLERFPYFVGTVWACALATLVIAILLLSPRLRSLLRFEKLVGRLPARVGMIVAELDDAILQYRDHLKGIGLWILVSPLTYSLFC